MNHKSLQIHRVPNNWEDPSPAIDKDEATFESIYNSGQWSIFSIGSVFKKSASRGTATYQYHCLTAGYAPVDKNVNSKCIVDG